MSLIVAPSSPAPLNLDRGQTLDAELRAGQMWQLEQGMLLIQARGQTGDGTWRLAMPDDWLDLETACGLTADEQVIALLPSRLCALPMKTQSSSDGLLRRLIEQQRRWALHLMGLRSGPVERRIGHLLELARQAMGVGALGDTGAIPALRDVARLVDAAPETACRVLARMRPSKSGSALRAPANGLRSNASNMPSPTVA